MQYIQKVPWNVMHSSGYIVFGFDQVKMLHAVVKINVQSTKFLLASVCYSHVISLGQSALL